MLDLDRISRRIQRVPLDRTVGRVRRVLGNLVESDGPEVALGDVCRLEPGRGQVAIPAEVVAFHGDSILLMPLADLQGLDNRTLVVPQGGAGQALAGPGLRGRVIDGLGRPIDGKGPLGDVRPAPLHRAPPAPMERRRIDEALPLGVRAIDAFCTIGRGQRVGIFAAAGVGKSTMLGMIARGSSADVNVIALIGERGREVREFLERDLGPAGLERSVLVVSTSADPPLLRMRAAWLATAIAESYRDEGGDVLLIMDSLTRFALAQREIGLAIGEQPTSRGFTPSVFAQLPRLLERSGAGVTGTITGLYSVLVEGDDPDEPVSDAARGLLDGHVVLSRRLAEAGQYPAVDVVRSLSRLMRDLVPAEHARLADRFRGLQSAYLEHEDLILTGSYRAGSDRRVDEALARRQAMRDYLCQAVDERVELEDALEGLARVLEAA